MRIILDQASISSHTNMGNGWTNQFMRRLAFSNYAMVTLLLASCGRRCSLSPYITCMDEIKKRIRASNVRLTWRFG